MKNTLFTLLLSLNAFLLFSQNSVHKTNLEADCSTDFWTTTVDGHIQQWRLSGGVISNGDSILSGAGKSLAYCGNSNSPTFYTDNWNSGQIGINYYDPVLGWVNIPTANHVQDNGGHLNDQYYTVVGAIIQYVNYWDGTNLLVIDSLPGEFFAGIFDIGVDSSGHAWICTASSPGTMIDSLKVYDPNGKINSYAFQYDLHGYGSFFLNDTLYLGTLQDSIFPVIINGSTAQLGSGILFPANNFTDMASCQHTGTTSISDPPNREIKVFPNPTSGLLVLPIEIERTDIWLYNSKGQLIKHKLDGNILDFSQAPAGLYYLQFNTEGRPNYYKVLKF